MIDPCPRCGRDLEHGPVKYRIDVLEMHTIPDIEKNRSAHLDICPQCYEELFGKANIDLANVWTQPLEGWDEWITNDD